MYFKICSGSDGILLDRFALFAIPKQARVAATQLLAHICADAQTREIIASPKCAAAREREWMPRIKHVEDLRGY